MPEKIYISYPDPTKETFVTKEIIDQFIDHFKQILNQYKFASADYFIKGVDFNKKNFADYISKSKVFVLIQFELETPDKIFEDEIITIVKTKNIKSDDLFKGTTGIYKVSLTPCKAGSSPLFSTIQCYNFFELNRFSKKFKSYLQEKETLPDEYWAKLLDLIVDISAFIRDKESDISTESKDDRYIFLAETSPDQSISRDEIAREMKHFGYKILPTVQFSESTEEIEKTIIDSLVHCKYSIQLMGIQYGQILKNSKYSLIDFQNRVLGEFQKNNPDKELHRFIWIPNDLKTTDQRQNLYIKRIKRDEAGVDTEIIEAPIEVFKTTVLDTINYGKLTPGVSNNKKRIYLVFEEKEKESAKVWIEKLKERKIDPLFLSFDKQVGIYGKHLKYLSEADAVLIYVGRSNEEWLRSKIRDLVKVPGYVEDKMFKAIGVILGNATKNQMTNYFNEKIDIIQENSKDTEGIDQFISKLN